MNEKDRMSIRASCTLIDAHLAIIARLAAFDPESDDADRAEQALENIRRSLDTIRDLSRL